MKDRQDIIEKFIPKNLIEGMFKGGIISITYSEVADFSTSSFNTKSIIFTNSGGYPLSDFTVIINNTNVEPYYKPAIVFPKDRGIIILTPEEVDEWHLSDSILEIKSAQGVSLKIMTNKLTTGLTGYSIIESFSSKRIL